MISFAQNFEDVLLERAFRDLTKGFYVDLGACDPTTDSVTKHFYDRGWSGINIEPGSIFERLAADRQRDVNLNVAVSDYTGEIILKECQEYPGLSSIQADVAEGLRDLVKTRVERRVCCVTLNDVLAEYAPSKLINFLKIDVEGHELVIVRSTNWNRFRPEIILIEATIPNSTVQNHEEWEPFFLISGYHFVYFDGLNRFYVRTESSHLKDAFRVAVNVFDDFFKYDPRINILETAVEQARCEAKLASAALAEARRDLAALSARLARESEEAAARRDALARAEFELNASRQRMKEAEEWRDRFLGTLQLDGGPNELRAVLPLARVIRAVRRRRK